MRRRLPAGLRFRLLIALLATSVVTLGVAALVVLPPLQDRLRDQTVETVEDAVADHVGQFDRELAALQEADVPYTEYDTRLFPAANALEDQSGARVLVLHGTRWSRPTPRHRRPASSTTPTTRPRSSPRRCWTRGSTARRVSASSPSRTATP